MRTIIFLNGFLVPKFLAKSKLCWYDDFWKGYRRIYYSSKTPVSDNMVNREVKHLTQLVNQYPDVIVAGHSLGAWWAANLACHSAAKIKKVVFWTPLGDTREYSPLFNVTPLCNPVNQTPNPNIQGPSNSLLLFADQDLIVPYAYHSTILYHKFNSEAFQLQGGHFLQENHQVGLEFMKKWIEL